MLRAKSHHPVKSQKGFTLIEVIVILAVIAILAAMAVPAALRIFQVTSESATNQEIDNLKKALLGNPQKLQTSFRSDFGYLGDIGCLPYAAIGGLDRLSTQGTLPGPTFDTTKQAGAGWRGPYISGTPGEDFKKDQWGNDYTYTSSGCTAPFTATITSNGPDGAPSTADDITVAIVANETTATVRGTVKNTSGVGLASVPVEYYSAATDGTLTTTTATTNASGNYSFSSAPFGQRAVAPKPITVFLVPGSVTTSNGNGTSDNINFQVANYTSSAITITHMTVNCAGSGSTATRYDDIRVSGGADLTSANNIQCSASTTQITLSTAQTIPANPTLSASLRVVVDTPDTQLPDLVLRGGSTMTFNIEHFETNAGVTVNMSGTKTISVSFYSAGPTLITTLTVVTP